MKLVKNSHHETKIARIYMRVSTNEQELERQESLVASAQAAGYHLAGIYREKASGAVANRPELVRMVNDLQAGETVIAEKMDRISRLPLPEAEALIASIREKGAKLAIPGVVDFEDLTKDADSITKIVLEAVQEMLLKLTLQMARDDYETRRKRQKEGIVLAREAGKYQGRPKDHKKHQKIIELRQNYSIAKTAHLVPCSEALVKTVWRAYQQDTLSK